MTPPIPNEAERALTDAQLAAKLNYMADCFHVVPAIKSPFWPTADDLRLAAQRLDREISEVMEATAWNVETELGEPPYSRRHSLRVLLGRAVSMIAPSLSQHQCMEEADRMLRAALTAAISGKEG